MAAQLVSQPAPDDVEEGDENVVADFALHADGLEWDEDEEAGSAGAATAMSGMPPALDSPAVSAVPAPPELLDRLLNSDLVMKRICSFMPSAFDPVICRRFYEAYSMVLRRRALNMLARTVPLHVAELVERELFVGCGCRIWPAGEYQKRLRRCCLNLSMNAELRSRLESAELVAGSFVRLSEDEMKSPALAARDREHREAALSARIKKPPTGHIVGVHRCNHCGGTSQWLRRHSRPGNLDPTRCWEVLVCIDCLSTGPFQHLPALAVASASVESGSGTTASRHRTASGIDSGLSSSSSGSAVWCAAPARDFADTVCASGSAPSGCATVEPPHAHSGRSRSFSIEGGYVSADSQSAGPGSAPDGADSSSCATHTFSPGRQVLPADAFRARSTAVDVESLGTTAAGAGCGRYSPPVGPVSTGADLGTRASPHVKLASTSEEACCSDDADLKRAARQALVQLVPISASGGVSGDAPPPAKRQRRGSGALLRDDTAVAAPASGDGLAEQSTV
jgi:hypothetical protein